MSGPLHVAVEVCPVCGNTRRLFTCTSCVSAGNFNSSDKRSPYGNARYVDRQKRLRLLTNLRQLKSNEVLLDANRRSNALKKRESLNKLQMRVDVLRCAVSLAEEQLEHDKNRLCATAALVEEKKSSVAVAKERLCEAQRIMNMPQMKNEIVHTREKLAVKSTALQIRRRQFIHHLVVDIFPITRHAVLPEYGTPPRHTIATQISNVDVVLETSITAESDLEEATRTAYIGGRWISEQESTESVHCILDAGLPSSGDYDKYYEWLKSQRSVARSEDSSSTSHGAPVLAIPAALGYTAQLVEQIASCLNIHLTSKAHHSEFCVHVGARKKFFDAVNRLNSSVMYICFSQGISSASMDHEQVLLNLELCLSPENTLLGRSDPFDALPFYTPDCPFDSDSSVEELTFDSSDSESADEPGDWDSLMDLPDVPDSAQAQADPDVAAMSASDLTAASSRLVSSAAASVASLWPWKKQ